MNSFSVARQPCPSRKKPQWPEHVPPAPLGCCALVGATLMPDTNGNYKISTYVPSTVYTTSSNLLKADKHWSLKPCSLVQRTEPAHMFLTAPGSRGMSGCPTVAVVVLTPLKRLTVWVTASIGEIGAVSVSAFAEVRITNWAKVGRCMAVVTGE